MTTPPPAAPEPKLPDHMGVWDEGGDTIWLPRSLYPKRSDAIKWATEQWTCDWLEVRCRSRCMRYDPAFHPGWTQTEDLWIECDKDEPDAFPVWRLETT